MKLADTYAKITDYNNRIYEIHNNPDMSQGDKNALICLNIYRIARVMTKSDAQRTKFYREVVKAYTRSGYIEESFSKWSNVPAV